MEYVSGHIWSPEGFWEGHIGFEDGMIVEVGKGRAKQNVAEGTILPTFINAHSHIVDYVVPVDLGMSLVEVVAPPDGLKYRVLKATPMERQRRAVSYISECMLRKGVSAFADFREGSAEGSMLLQSAQGARPFIMGKTRRPRFDRDEVLELLKVADGIGPSAISDWDYEELRELSRLVHSRGKVFALHCSERVREDLDKVLDLKPSYLVHMCQATDGDLEVCAQEGIPIVVCPRSNMFFGLTTPLRRMIEAGVVVALGTDNAMISFPDMFVEMEFAGRLLRSQGMSRLDCVLSMAACNGRKIINERPLIEFDPGTPCDFMVVREHGGDPVTDVVLRTAGFDPLLVCVGGKRRGPQ
ncbi:MAG: amidohydrolase family protein [Methanomassiliicoccaceae archaeon]|nr:amidohydrolase family protein [Euryarchaeota archaeon]HOB38024.1 amidohydrolase family protein [Methanomassiliicoccaceae archaeon]HOQ25790.1 amidohydrolase family protein [Methanomassiliicoccaceae archaeon]HQA20800.1 amidohydrolase family protein [Methanomassiliicoccaceae archaeon]HQD87885.1 amidohydrolase family protein [Methanomassiliicoccaceae archaeon]